MQELTMRVSTIVFNVFGHFHNLNLLVLLEDLRAGRAARHAWLNGSRLCPVAHGLPEGFQVQTLQAMGQTTDMAEGCDFAARHLGADRDAVRFFVEAWDDATLAGDALTSQLADIWHERLADAEAMQEILEPGRPAITETRPTEPIAGAIETTGGA
jgi:hypothetical protein